MNVTFTAIMTGKDKDDKMEFTAPVKVSKIDNFTTYEFTDPSTKVTNLIEVSDKVVNIFAGPVTYNFKLNETVQNRIEMSPGIQILNTYLFDLDRESGYVNFKYKMHFNDGNEIGTYNIILKIQ